MRSSFFNKIQLMSSRRHSKSTSVGKGRSWSKKKLTKSDIKWRGYNKKSDSLTQIFSMLNSPAFRFSFCDIRWGCDSITVSY